ncbi:MAG: TolC family protein [Bacteroidales bacterium]|nr:TolC family protein [Bacteroidales bacterium]MBQ9186109.1 TolC family protein [Bacteroidales bacterium]
MKVIGKILMAACTFFMTGVMASAQEETTVLTLDDAIRIALSENTAVRVADKEIERAEYAKKGTYASLFPQVNGTGTFQRTIKKQVMYMDGMSGGSMFASIFEPIITALEQNGIHVDMSALTGGNQDENKSSSSEGISVGRWNTFNGGISAAMPLVNAQLWESLKVSKQSVELAVEQARSSRLDAVTQVKQAFFSVLLAKEAFNVYKDVYENAMENLAQVQRKFDVQKVSELELTRAKSNVASAIPNVYNAESSVMLALWQLKAVMGVDLEMNMDVAGKLEDYAQSMFYDIHENDDVNLDRNTTMRQLAIQADQLASAVKMQKYAYLPTLSLSFSYSMNAMTNDFKFSQYKWTPYSYLGLSLNIPIFSGGKRHADLKAAQIQAESLDLTRSNTERQLKIAIRSYLNTMETNMKSYASSQEAVELAQKAYDISQKSYNVGKSTLTDLHDAELVLTQARLGSSQAIFNFVNAKASLEQVLGKDFTVEEK